MYKEHKWQVCRYLKVIALLIGIFLWYSGRKEGTMKQKTGHKGMNSFKENQYQM